jgi:K+-sensing histidine kinase KdpD
MTTALIFVIMAALLVARDVFARRRERQLLAEMALLRDHAKENDRLANVGQLVSGLAQDLKSPLQGMLGSAELLAASDPADAGSAQQVQDIRDNVTRAAGIVRNLLTFTETTVLDRRWLDLNELVHGSIQRRRPDGGVEGRVGFQGAARLPLVYLDGRQLDRVITTLLARTGNGGLLRATGDVVVSTRRGGAAEDRLIIDIDDPSLPLTEDEASWSGDLDACRRVLEAHGGSLEVERQRAGGSRFHLELPVTAIPGSSPT